MSSWACCGPDCRTGWRSIPRLLAPDTRPRGTDGDSNTRWFLPTLMARVGDVATNTETSEHKRAGVVPGRLEAALARAETNEAMYHSLVDRLPAITYTEALDDGRTLSISPQIELLLGCSQDEWMADPLLWMSMMHPEDVDRVILECHDR